jgi:hypothetical protein
LELDPKQLGKVGSSFIFFSLLKTLQVPGPNLNPVMELMCLLHRLLALESAFLYSKRRFSQEKAEMRDCIEKGERDVGTLYRSGAVVVKEDVLPYA